MRSVGVTVTHVMVMYIHVVNKIVQFRTVSTTVREGGVCFLFLVCQNSLSPHLSFQRAIKLTQRT